MIKKTRPSLTNTLASTQINKRNDFRALIPALLIALVAITAEAAVFYAPPAEGQMAVFFPPNTSETSVFSAISSAGGSFVGTSRFSNIIIVYAPDSGFRKRISKYGGWFTLAAEGLCAPSVLETQS